ncbi:hypothetical protein RYX36_023287, partial [Vicia faba]
PASDYVNLTELLDVAGPFHTFLGYLESTKVLDTSQNQENNTEEGITIFVPQDSAFNSLEKPSLSKLKGGDYTLNFTDSTETPSILSIFRICPLLLSLSVKTLPSAVLQPSSYSTRPFTSMFIRTIASSQHGTSNSRSNAPAPDYVNLTELLNVAGPFHTFLGYLESTKVLDTSQNQENNTEEGITIFVPQDSAFNSLEKPSLSKLKGGDYTLNFTDSTETP